MPGAYVWEAVRPSVGPGSRDPPAKHRPSVVPGGLRAHTLAHVHAPWGVGGQLGIKPAPPKPLLGT